MPRIEITNEEHWHELRAKYGGSSEAAALFNHGYANMPSMYSLYALKKGLIEIPFEDDLRVRIGSHIEPAIANLVAAEKGWDLISQSVYQVHEDEGLRMGSTVDRYVVEHEDGPGIVELKNRDFLQWRDHYDETDASDRDKIQLAHQMACNPAIEWGAVACLVGGSDLKVYIYRRDQLSDIIADVENAWRAFWKIYDANIEPMLTDERELPYWMKATIDKERLPAKELEGEEWDKMILLYMACDARAKDNEKTAKKLRAQIIQGVDRAETGFTDKYWVNLKYSQVAESVSTRKAHERVNLKIEERADAPATDNQIDPNIIDAG